MTDIRIELKMSMSIQQMRGIWQTQNKQRIFAVMSQEI